MAAGNLDRLCSRNGPNGEGGHHEIACSVSRSGQHGPSCACNCILCKLESVLKLSVGLALYVCVIKLEKV